MIEGPVVLDANILFGALLRDSTTRHLILHGGLDLHAPAWLWDELHRNRDFLLAKSRATEEAFDLLVELLQEHIRSIPDRLLRPHFPAALERVGGSDRLDAPYVAAGMAVAGSLWSHDKALAQRAGVPVFVTEDLVRAVQGD